MKAGPRRSQGHELRGRGNYTSASLQAEFSTASSFSTSTLAAAGLGEGGDTALCEGDTACRPPALGPQGTQLGWGA